MDNLHLNGLTHLGERERAIAQPAAIATIFRMPESARTVVPLLIPLQTSRRSRYLIIQAPTLQQRMVYGNLPNGRTLLFLPYKP